MLFRFIHRVIMRSFLSGVIRYVMHRFLTMKRSERNRVKTESDQRHSDQHHTEPDNHEHHISGSIDVRGEIETKRPPDLTLEHKTERKEDNAHEKKKFVAEIATLVVVAIYAALTWWQGCSTKKAADAARDNIIQIERNVHLDERAWLGVENIPGSAKIGEFFGAVVYFKNTGKTPAKNMRFAGQLDKGQSDPDAAGQCGDALKDTSRWIVAPGSTHSIPARTVGQWPILQKGWQKSLSDKGQKIYIYGCVVYDDIFIDKPHWMTFCAWWRDDISAFQNCEHGNDIGDGDIPEK
jgi:hypothetical protein